MTTALQLVASDGMRSTTARKGLRLHGAAGARVRPPAAPPERTEAMDTTAELVTAAAGGDRHAWDQLTDRFTRLLWAIARGHRLSEADAADVVQTTWLRLVENLSRLREPERVGAWLATTARRECLLAQRRSGRQVLVGDDLTLERPATYDSSAPELRLEAVERAEALREALDRLSERCQVLLRVLAADPAPTYDAVGAALDMPIGSIGPTRARCLERLRANLDAPRRAPTSGEVPR